MAVIEELAPAKINLTLRVLGRRADGYHELESLVAFARDAADRITLDTTRAPGISVTGPFAPTLAGENLIDVTLRRLAAADAGLTLGHVTLDKRLPVAAGIGGGSADAAAVLRAVRRANPARAAAVDWSGIAASLGADVPVCMSSSAAFMTGIGEQLTGVAALPTLHAVLANPRVAVPADKTARVFRELSAGALTVDIARTIPPRGAAQCERLIAGQGNDLTAAARAIVPQIDAVLDALAASRGAQFARLSGGGPTCFALYPDAAMAAAAASALAAAHPSWWIAATALG